LQPDSRHRPERRALRLAALVARPAGRRPRPRRPDPRRRLRPRPRLSHRGPAAARLPALAGPPPPPPPGDPRLGLASVAPPRPRQRRGALAGPRVCQGGDGVLRREAAVGVTFNSLKGYSAQELCTKLPLESIISPEQTSSNDGDRSERGRTMRHAH